MKTEHSLPMVSMASLANDKQLFPLTPPHKPGQEPQHSWVITAQPQLVLVPPCAGHSFANIYNSTIKIPWE